MEATRSNQLQEELSEGEQSFVQEVHRNETNSTATRAYNGGQNTDRRGHNTVTCGKTYEKKGFLRRHQKRNRLEVKSVASELAEVVQTESTKQSFLQHEEFDAKFTNAQSLRRHVFKKQSAERPLECVTCKKKFSTMSDLNSYKKIHTQEKPFDCKFCMKRFPRRSYCIAHEPLHTREKPSNCVICQQVFSNQFESNIHLRVHTKETYKCEICNVKFCLKTDLIQHQSIHTGEKPYECKTCKAKFRKKRHLVKHERTHTGEKPYQCEICMRKFSRKLTLNRHRRVHGRE